MLTTLDNYKPKTSPHVSTSLLKTGLSIQGFGVYTAARPYTERGLLDNWEHETKQFKLIKKACSELQVGNIFQATVEPYFCEVVEILPDKFLPGYRQVRLKLLPDGLIGEVYLQINRVVLIKE